MQVYYPLITLSIVLAACHPPSRVAAPQNPVKPRVVTEKVVFDTDDPAIWIHPRSKDSSLVVGTDKENSGGLYVFDLQGHIVNKALGMQRPNNVDIVQGFLLNGVRTDLAVATERGNNSLRFYTLPQLNAIDGGGLQVFEGQDQRQPMGIGIYTNPADKQVYVIVGRKSGPAEGYLWQYKLVTDSGGQLAMQLVRKFGKYSAKKEIESIAVDNELGYIYYSDEQVGIRKYYADPAKGDQELALFGAGEYKADNEGISIYKFEDGTGYILVSDQSNNSFNVYPREGSPTDSNLHRRIAAIPVSTIESDGSEVTSVTLPGFEGGLFVAMSDDRSFQLYSWKDLADRAGLRSN